MGTLLQSLVSASTLPQEGHLVDALGSTAASWPSLGMCIMPPAAFVVQTSVRRQSILRKLHRVSWCIYTNHVLQKLIVDKDQLDKAVICAATLPLAAPSSPPIKQPTISVGFSCDMMTDDALRFARRALHTQGSKAARCGSGSARRAAPHGCQRCRARRGPLSRVSRFARPTRWNILDQIIRRSGAPS